jgi:ubiquinone biosynthesis protein Coq4
MLQPIDRAFGERFLTSVDNFYAHGVHLLFNEWWDKAPADAIDKFVDAIDASPELAKFASEGWLADPLDVDALRACPAGSLGAAYRSFLVDNNLALGLAEGYRELHEQFERSGQLERMPAVLRYKVLRGYQTHDLHHVLTGYPATPLGELALQAFELAQLEFPYAAMWISVVTSHMTLVDPWLITPAMDAITDGWTFGRQARSIQFVRFEDRFDEPLENVRRDYGLVRAAPERAAADPQRMPELLHQAA